MPESFSTGFLNQLDHVVVSGARKSIRALLTSFTRLGCQIPDLSIDKTSLKGIVLMFSDQQLITVLAILTVCFVQIRTITAYHFQIVSCLASLAFTMHAVTMDILQDELLQRPIRKRWRTTAILILDALTFVTFLPTGHDLWLYTYGLPMTCIWDSMSGNYGGSNTNWMIFWMLTVLWQASVTLYVFSSWRFVRRLVNRVFGPSFSAMLKVLLVPRKLYFHASEKAIQSNHTLIRATWVSLQKSCHGTAVFVFIIAELLYSEAFVLLSCWFFMVNNSTTVFWIWAVATSEGREGSESQWSFGQAVPVFLLLLPLATITETLLGKTIFGLVSLDRCTTNVYQRISPSQKSVQTPQSLVISLTRFSRRMIGIRTNQTLSAWMNAQPLILRAGVHTISTNLLPAYLGASRLSCWTRNRPAVCQSVALLRICVAPTI